MWALAAEPIDLRRRAFGGAAVRARPLPAGLLPCVWTYRDRSLEKCSRFSSQAL
jgi:hypothetical protein